MFAALDPSRNARADDRRTAPTELQRDGALDPELHPGVAARAFIAMQNGVVSWWLEDPSRASRDDVVETLIRLHPAVAGATAWKTRWRGRLSG